MAYTNESTNFTYSDEQRADELIRAITAGIYEVGYHNKLWLAEYLQDRNKIFPDYAQTLENLFNKTHNLAYKHPIQIQQAKENVAFFRNFMTKYASKTLTPDDQY